ncbi:mitochondrial-associated sphingomyelin phosphodiesterase domain-containing protein [Phthorimaea operculella]|nr:mitochondrial-associated sphingomyelin phosphodiesterase domain-containing protein [Phthorimaea operculella]
MCSTPERVRTVRVLVKHIHSYSAKHLTDTAARSSALRKYARQIMCARAYQYVKHLVLTWPLDASFRLVLELWLSLIQPWRYTDNNITHDRYPGHNNNQEENTGVLDSNYMQFIAENYPSYTCIFNLVLPRFMRMDLTAYKNAVMLFRLGKVFSQQHLVPILWNLEQAMMDGSNLLYNPDSSYNNSTQDQSYTYNGVSLHKWVAIAKQAITELNMSTTFEYDPVWSDSNKQQYASEFIKRIHLAKLTAENYVEEYGQRLRQQHKGVLASIKDWLMITDKTEDDLLFEECKRVPSYLNNSIHYFSSIFGVNESSLVAPDPIVGDTALDHSSFANSTNFAFSITSKLRSNPTSVQYMGDPDLMPITSYESTILVRMLYQIASKINELYEEEFRNVYHKNNLLGFVAREVLEKPCTIRNYVKDVTSHQNIVTQELPPRLSLRKLGVSLGLIFIEASSWNSSLQA